jgi:hypothetical protein
LPAAVERHDEDFVARNTFLHLALGLVAAGERVEALTHAPSPDDAPLDARDERLVDAVVGLLAFTRDLRARLDAAARSAPDAPAAPTPAPGRLPLR